MADPLSIAASIAGLLSLADSAFRGVFRYTQDASNAQKDIKALCTELQSVAVVLHGVKLLTETLEQDATRSSPLRLEHVHSCRAVLNEILGRIVRFDPTPGDNKSIKHAMQALKWPFGKSRTMEMVNELSRQKETLQLALQASTMADLMACLSKVQNVESKLNQIQKSVESLKVLTRIKIDHMRSKILDFFMVDDPSPNLRTSWNLRQPMTGLWLTESPRFREWLTEPRSKLWLSGIPGAGKTVLAGAVIREALSRLETTPKVGVAFFFCDYKKKSSWDISNILRALMAQLGRQRDSSFQLLKEYYDKIEPQFGFRMTPDIEDLRDLFVRQANEYDQVLVVVDGLDECGDKAGEVSRMLSEVARYARTISMALCSRHEADISDQLETDFDHIPIAAHTEDISLFVGAELEKRIEQKRLRLGNASLKDEIMSKLIEGAQGMFRWVACQLDVLCECPTDADRRAALEELPRTLPETYERILHRINQRNGRVQRLVQLSLKLIAVEEDDFKLTIPQLCQAVSTPDEIGVTLDKEAIVRDEEISRSCSSFIRKSNDGRFFEFSHFSVREYLQDSSLLQRPDLALYHIADEKVYQITAIQSLRFLLLKNFDGPVSRDFEAEAWSMQKTCDEFPLYHFAAVTWPIMAHRAQAAGMAQSGMILDLEKVLLHQKKTTNYKNWLIAFYTYINEPNGSDGFKFVVTSTKIKHAVDVLLGRDISTLHVAAALNLVDVGLWLIDQGACNYTNTKAPSMLDFAALGISSFVSFGHDPLHGYTYRSIKKDSRLCEALLARGETISAYFWTLASGWLPRPEDIWEIQKSLPHSVAFETDALDFVVYLIGTGLNKTDFGRQLCTLIWIHAIECGYKFTTDESLLPMEITMSDNTIYSTLMTSIKKGDLETLAACEDDPCFDQEMTIQDLI
ncbi:hypothetical protein PFICI_06452 [Pestalotiopsis fici W106-1]|uniref:Nephrocystin 3-like N-terminal domain-containing protein n=1 Tax=Pestalotiopsis fici (strain W106-1 / CGMCC3.15140) TaxID=1229662 RepID=W3X5X0_PESFW|nr:uncharacterized protein PFICI_06452 [Pestalotiopsis fici W106-1]ETS81450.1 hypothetical protein PFICI_06452 [Pestalotiopsis fici W106-1]